MTKITDSEQLTRIMSRLDTWHDDLSESLEFPADLIEAVRLILPEMQADLAKWKRREVAE